MKINKLFILIFIVLCSTLTYADEDEYLGILSPKDKTYYVGKGDGTIEIKRVMTDCARIAGFLQTKVPTDGINIVTEIEMLNALNDEDSIVVDMRVQDQYLQATIPTAINIPYSEIDFRLDEFGCQEADSGWDCSKASKVYGFCNGPLCTQSPTAMRSMVKNGFPAEKIYYYRGGMMTWSAVGLTMHRGKP